MVQNQQQDMHYMHCSEHTTASTGAASGRPMDATDGVVPGAKAREESVLPIPMSAPESIVSPRDVYDVALQPETIRTRTGELQQQLLLELAPQTALEQIVVADLARHAAGMAYAADAEPAVLGGCVTVSQRCAPANLPENLPAKSLASPLEFSGQQSSLAMAFAAPAFEGVSRYSTRHNIAFYRALETFRRMRQRSALGTAAGYQAEQFSTESACVAYLLGRRQLPG